uniref:Pre-mRNA-splicing factor 38 n=1 Tax=Blastobotrys adeninivorans TaxID=409370 RepID=A0A060TAZ0_BLAAD
MSEYIVDRGMVQGVTAQGVNPATLIEKITRERMYESRYWKEECFGLDAATLCDRAVELKFIGGNYGSNLTVSPFLCLLFKMIQLSPEREIILEYLNQEDFKYLRALAAMYIRIFFRPHEVFQLLEPLLADYRKLRLRSGNQVTLTHMDEFIDALLTQQRVCDTTLPRLPKRIALEDMEQLEPRESALQSELESDSDSNSDGGDG